jgi:hypothetical protein
VKGEISKALEEGVALRRQLIADGTPRHEADYIVGQGLKAVLGAQRSEPWRFYCEHCRDTGWITITPPTDEQARLRKLYGDAESHAGYVVKCEPCKWLPLEREKRRQKFGDGDEEDFVTAGKTKPKRHFSKFGG